MAPPEAATYLIGTYTERLPHVDGKAEGILAAEMLSGELAVPAVVATSRNPSFVAISADRRYVYAVNETVEFEGQPGGGVTAYRRDVDTGSLNELNTRSSLGVEPAHLALDPSETFVLVANYRSGSITVYQRAADGSLGEPTSHIQHEGHSVHPGRQTGPHAHMICFDPVSGDVLVPDLGLDAVLVYRLSGEGQLAELPDRRIRTAPGAGPRHLAFHPDGQTLFLINELDNTLTVLRRAGEGWEPGLTVSTLPPDFSGHTQAAAVRVTPSGQLVAASNRGEASDTIALFRFDNAAGTLELASVTPSGGREPREMIVTADGQHLLVANQDTDSVGLFAIDEDKGTLEALGAWPVPTPVCLVGI